MKKIKNLYAAIWVFFGILLLFNLCLSFTDDKEKVLPSSGYNEYSRMFDKGEYDQLILEAQNNLLTYPQDLESLLALAKTYAMKGSVKFAEKENGEIATKYAEKVLALDPDNSEAYRVKGYAYEIQEDYLNAHLNYDKAIELNPRNFQALSNKGHAYDLQGDLKNAEHYYKLSYEVYPSAEHLLLNLARLEYRQRKYEKAEQSILSLLSYGTNDRIKAEAYQVLAEIHKINGDFDLAYSAVMSALSLDDRLAAAWVSRGSILIKKLLWATSDSESEKIYNDVYDSANRALAVHPQQASAYALLYHLAMIKNDSNEAEKYRQLGLSTIDKDISLGQKERNALRWFLEAQFYVITD